MKSTTTLSFKLWWILTAICFIFVFLILPALDKKDQELLNTLDDMCTVEDFSGNLVQFPCDEIK